MHVKMHAHRGIKQSIIEMEDNRVKGAKLLKLKAFEYLGVKRRWQICQLLCILQMHFVIKQHKSLQINFNQFTA